MSIITDIHLIEQLQKRMLSSMAVAPIAWTITLTNTIDFKVSTFKVYLKSCIPLEWKALLFSCPVLETLRTDQKKNQNAILIFYTLTHFAGLSDFPCL